MKINDIATAAQSLADYCYREGEAADLGILSAQAGLIFGHVTELQDQTEREKASTDGR